MRRSHSYLASRLSSHLALTVALPLAASCAVDDDNLLDEADSALTAQVAPASVVGGPGPRSGYPWFTGHWVNGSDTRNRDFEAFRDMPADSVTQSMPGLDFWYEHAGCASEACVDRELQQTRAAFAPSFDGVFAGDGWKDHVWPSSPGDQPATAHRQRLIHLGWMNAIPASVGNPGGSRPRLWDDLKNGAADKYLFLLGRKFAYLDARAGDPAFPMTFDVTYEWTLTSHPSFPGGHYTVGGVVHETSADFPFGWSRMIRVFREGYQFQRGTPCPYNFSWRPQLVFSVHDAHGHVVRPEAMWPNDVQTWQIAKDVVVHGVKLLPKGPIGAQASLLCVSWHDSSAEDVRGASFAAPGNNWQRILDGFPSHWGMQEAASFAQTKHVKLCLPEWGPIRGDSGKAASAHPGDVVRFTHAFVERHKSVISYENVFDQGSGELEGTWVPAQPAAQDAGTVYRALWHR